MPINLIPLPYSSDALAPAISAETLEVHHGKHHRGYVDKTNAAIAGSALAEKPLEQIIAAARRDDRTLFNNAAQVWNHGFYWHSLTPGKSAPGGALATAISRDFGSVAALTDALAAAAEGHFASGYAWLLSDGGTLSIVDTHDAETFADGEAIPLLAIDVWEHAYYLDRKNARPEYVKAAIERLDWEFAAANYARASVWTYPA